MGNIKFDLQPPRDIEERGRQLRARYAAGRPVWVAGSTHPGEEAVCLQAHRIVEDWAISRGCPAPLLVLAPRHPERFDAVARLLSDEGMAAVRRSQEAALASGGTRVLLLDTLGELMDFYAASDAAFVGGSLVPVGGHNLLEPAALGRPVLTGPHSFNAPEAAQLLGTADALTRVDDAASLATALERVMASPEEAGAQGRRGSAAVAANRGAAARTLAALGVLLPPLTAKAASGSVPAPGSPPSASG